MIKILKISYVEQLLNFFGVDVKIFKRSGGIQIILRIS